MLRLVFVGLLLSAQLSIIAQAAPVELWRSIEYTKTMDVKYPTIAIDKYQNTYMTTTQTDVAFFAASTLVKYDSAGQALWQQSYPPWIIGYLYGSFTVDSLGYSYVSSNFNGGLPEYDADAILVKYSPEGDQLWEANYSGNQAGDSYLYYSDLDPYGRLITLGMNWSDTAVADNFLFVSAIDTATGEEVWKTKIPGVFWPQNLRVHADRIEVLATRYLPGQKYYVIAQLDFNGVILQEYAKPYVGYDLDFNSIAKNGDILLGNRGFGYNAARLNAQGDTLWAYSIPSIDGSVSNWARAIAEDDSMNTYVTGATQHLGYSADFITTKIAPNGTVVWEKVYRLTEEATFDTGNNLFVNEQYVFASGGSKDTTGKVLGVINVYDKVKGDEVYTILIEQDSSVGIGQCIVVKDKIYYTGYSHHNISNSVSAITGAFKLSKIISPAQEPTYVLGVAVFPNPTTDYIYIGNLDRAVFTDLEVLDITGRIIAHRKIEESTMIFDLSGYPAGTYILSIKGKNVTLNKKLVKT